MRCTFFKNHAEERYFWQNVFQQIVTCEALKMLCQFIIQNKSWLNSFFVYRFFCTYKHIIFGPNDIYVRDLWFKEHTNCDFGFYGRPHHPLFWFLSNYFSKPMCQNITFLQAILAILHQCRQRVSFSSSFLLWSLTSFSNTSPIPSHHFLFFLLQLFLKRDGLIYFIFWVLLSISAKSNISFVKSMIKSFWQR